MLNVRLFFFLSQCFYCRQTCQTISFILTCHCPLPFFLILIPHTISFFPHNLVSCHDEIKCNWNKDTTKVLEVLSESNFFKNHLFLSFVSVFQRRRRHQRVEGHARVQSQLPNSLTHTATRGALWKYFCHQKFYCNIHAFLLQIKDQRNLKSILTTMVQIFLCLYVICSVIHLSCLTFM